MKIYRSVFYLILLFFILLANGCTYSAKDPGVDDAVKTAPAEKQAPADTPPAKTPLIVNDDFSNLTSTDPSLPVYDRYTIKERSKRGLPLVLPAISPYKEEKIVYLTFDDGPDDKNTPAVLDILKKANIKATFFVLGKNAALYPDMIQRIYQEGHALGNHSYDHDYKKLYASPSAYIAQMQQTDDILFSLLGVRPLITRAPGGTAGHFNRSFTSALQKNGYVEYGWNISTADAAPNHPIAQDFIDNVISQIDKRPFLSTHAIVLMHSSSNHEETVKALPTIIKTFKDRGYSFGVITPMTPSPW
jgi:Predicted xylanase/chitin deacetylase